jgi:hypothetical protein
MYAPKTKAPIGLIRKPAPNVISDSINEEKWSADGKNASPMAPAK